MGERHDGPLSPGSSSLPLGPDADRLWTRLLRARVAVAAILLLLQALLQSRGSEPTGALLLDLLYLGSTLATLRLRRPADGDSPWSARWLSTLWLDIACFALLNALAGSAFDAAPLFLLPVLLAATLGSLRLALASAAAASLVLLGDATLALWSEPAQAATRFMHSGLTGTGFFLIALLTHQLAQRLARELVLTRDSQMQVRLQGEVNRLIARSMSEGVLVFDLDGRVWHANPSALSMLDPASGTAIPADHLLLQWGRQGLAAGHEHEQTLDLPTTADGTQHCQLRVRLRLIPADGDTPPTGVLFLEDMRAIEDRIRTERLAAMGRVSAAVAHEIRNPLAAISQANALLAEDELTPEQRQLSAIIERNARRLAHTVDDILDVARTRPNPAAQDAIALDILVGDGVRDWQATQASPAPRLRLSLGTATVRVRFAPEQLRRVLINLLDNARQHGDTSTHGIEVWTESSHDGAALLGVWNAGPELAGVVQQHLFEPFFSSDSRSSGLGLYISRELCQRSAAEIHYRRQSRHGIEGNAFLVHLTGSAV